MPEVSVVMSTYNRSGMMPEAVATALWQRDVDLELIVVDNGSDDDTPATLAAIDDPRLRVIRNERSLGATGGRNTGLAEAAGDWVSLLDDDDLWAPDKLRAQLDAASMAGTDWAYAGCVFVDGSRRILGGKPPGAPSEVASELPVRFLIPGGMSNVLWRRDSLDANGLIDPQVTLTADWDVSLRLLRNGPPAAVPRPLIGYRQHGRNESRHAATWLAEFELIEQKHADLLRGRRINRGVQQRFVASESLRAGDRRAAARAYWAAVRLGDLGSVPRALSLLAPSAAHPWLRRRLLSDRQWLAQADWLEAVPTAMARRT